ncbi:recombination protein O N-terminal domain-containing protein [Candidatus Parcubacteria bacterium]|nr:recombination protein O N-terminal domain-containing protein [Candidatus Parcubacteria bacterium]
MGEADRIYSILTRELGLIRARATGVRKDVSKLRGNLEPISLTEVSLVKGKNDWRLTSASHIKSITLSEFLARPLLMLEKLVQGEENHPELFDAIEQFVISENEHDEIFEITLVAQILFHLGYLNKSDLDLDKKGLIKAINSGLEASML